MSIASKFETAFEAGLKPLISDLGSDVQQQAIEDSKAFLASMEQDALRWAELRSEGKLTANELRLLATVQAGLVKMHALTMAGLAEADIEHFRQGLINLLITSITAAIPV